LQLDKHAFLQLELHEAGRQEALPLQLKPQAVVQVLAQPEQLLELPPDEPLDGSSPPQAESMGDKTVKPRIGRTTLAVFLKKSRRVCILIFITKK